MNTDIHNTTQRGHLNRCCIDTLTRHAPKEPTEGVELPCRWCSDYMKWVDGAWERHSAIADWLTRETSPDVTAARHAEYNRITEGRFSQRLSAERVSPAPTEPFIAPRTLVCQICGTPASYLDTSPNGVTTYQCLNRHVSFVDHSKALRIR